MTAEEHIVCWIESSQPHYRKLLNIAEPDNFISYTGRAYACINLAVSAYQEMVHGGASWSWYRSTRKATPDQFAALYKELRGIYERDGDCILQICERVTQGHKKRFYAEVRRIRKGEN